MAEQRVARGNPHVGLRMISVAEHAAGLGRRARCRQRFGRDGGTLLRVVAGQELSHFKLHAGEEVRTPLVVVQFYEGDAPRAQNLWRRWMIAHNMPHPGRGGGKPIGPMTGACSSHQAHEMIYATEEQQNHFIDRYVQEKLHLDYWWMDAGWYVNNRILKPTTFPPV